MRYVSHRTPAARGGGGGSRGPSTGGNKGIDSDHENHCTKKQWFTQASLPNPFYSFFRQPGSPALRLRPAPTGG
ncbi:hypothetical protein ISE1_1357 [plant metagenome]|uniref:Uncharacterized protein n=1 Tax=plant metagenome TaxID=1297885 RepID=A0A484SPC3_9ZZZZ